MRLKSFKQFLNESDKDYVVFKLSVEKYSAWDSYFHDNVTKGISEKKILSLCGEHMIEFDVEEILKDNLLHNFDVDTSNVIINCSNGVVKIPMSDIIDFDINKVDKNTASFDVEIGRDIDDTLTLDMVTLALKYKGVEKGTSSNVNESIPDIKLKDLLNDGEAKTLDLSVLKNLKAIIDKAIANYQEHSDKEYKIDIEENNGERVTWIKAKQTDIKIDITSFGTISRYSDSIKSDVYREYSEKLKGKTYPSGATLVKYLITKAFEESSSQSSFEKNVAKYFKFKIK